ncbi:Hypothetical predicted protein [Mytilus galloprovincialis]|uniref:Endonuclease/exonuclease/phosphatase domain-containing protein n=1 Tax=Mytilus galloprovincialis TaxID=29158 RepID=A0A8B6HNH8_MYTGA|nr:Hypothetical predicted protein [Mytilus galloprovincialis]
MRLLIEEKTSQTSLSATKLKRPKLYLPTTRQETITNEDPTKLHGIPLIYSHPNKKAATGVCQQKSDNTQKIWNGTKKAHVQHPGPSAPLPPRQHYYVRRLESQIPPTHHPVNQQPLYNMATGGDINEDLNAGKPTNQRKEYLKKFINEIELKFDNIGNTFINSKGCECSEIDYFLHNITPDILGKGKSILKCQTNASDHYPISMSINWKHEKLDMNQKKTRPKSKIKWDKVDKDLYKAITDKEALKLQESIITDSLESQEVVERMNDILTTASQNSSGNKTIYQSRPKLKVWNSDIKNALKEKTDYVQRMAKRWETKRPSKSPNTQEKARKKGI